MKRDTVRKKVTSTCNYTFYFFPLFTCVFVLRFGILICNRKDFQYKYIVLTEQKKKNRNNKCDGVIEDTEEIDYYYYYLLVNIKICLINIYINEQIIFYIIFISFMSFFVFISFMSFFLS